MSDKIQIKLNAGELLNKLKYKGTNTIEFFDGYDACKKQLAMLICSEVNLNILEMEKIIDSKN